MTTVKVGSMLDATDVETLATDAGVTTAEALRVAVDNVNKLNEAAHYAALDMLRAILAAS